MKAHSIQHIARSLTSKAIFAILLVAGLLLPLAAQAATINEISQYGITWTFDKEYEYGQFANGDYWVVGPVIITAITPAFDGQRHGWEANPVNIVKQGFDSRAYNFDASLVPQLPYTAQPITSIVKAVSNLADPPLCLRNSNHTCYLSTAAVLTVLAEVPSDDGATVFRPPYFGLDKPLYSVKSLHLEKLASISSLGVNYVPTLQWIEERFRRLQLDHKVNWVGRTIHPDSNMPDYGGDIALDTGDAALRLMLDDSTQAKMPALIQYLQMGIDLFHILKNGGSWPANGGHCSGRKLPIILTGILFDNQAMKDAVKNAPNNTFQEDDHVYWSDVANNGKGTVLFGASENSNYWLNQVTDSGSRTARDPYHYIDGGHVPGESYQRGINSMIWKGPVIAMQLIPEIAAIWNNPNFVSYVDRWVTLGAWAQPDPCAPAMGICQGGENSGKACTYANLNACPNGFCGGGVCGTGPHQDRPCSNDGGPSPTNDCGSYVNTKGDTVSSQCNINNQFFGKNYGPDSARPGSCIQDTDPSDGIGRHPYQHGKNADTGVYQSSFMNSMWDKYRLYHCINGIKDADEGGIDCGGSCVFDADKDGYLGKVCNHADPNYDCNDNDPKINPGMPEICTQKGEFDDNCDGRMCDAYYLDTDKDKINDCEDNCPFDCNLGQEDKDYDGKGDACDDTFSLFEDFELMTDGDFSQKRVPSGVSFEVISGKARIGTTTHWGYSGTFLQISGLANTQNLIVTKEGRNDWSDYTLKVLVGQKYSTGGLVLHYQDPANYYLLNLRSGKLELVQNNTTTTIDGTGSAITMGWGGGNAHYIVESIVQSNSVNFKVTKDATNVRTFIDAAPHTTKGSIGFFERGYSSGNYFIFDNIEVLFRNDYSGPHGSCAAQPILYGDLNGDGAVSIKDASLAARIAVGIDPLGNKLQVGDVDGDGVVNIKDAALIAKKVVGLIAKFPVEE